MPPWRNRLARSAVNRKVGGSSPPGGESFFNYFFLFLDAGCDITDDCDPNATCLFKDGQHKCSCNDGFQGDGKTCEKVIIGCNVLDNCAKYASCLFSELEGGYRCKCDTQRVRKLLWKKEGEK